MNIKELLKTIFRVSSTTLLIVLFAHIFMFIGVVEGTSMESTLEEPYILYGVKTKPLNLSAKRGDVVGIATEIYGVEVNIVKRVVGIPGDEIRISGLDIFLNGQLLKEEYIKEDMIYPYEDKSYKLSEDEYFVMGDNRNESMDSREFGPIDDDEIFAINLLYRDNWSIGSLTN